MVPLLQIVLSGVSATVEAGITVTVVVETVVQVFVPVVPTKLAVTVYTPLVDILTVLSTGFCWLELYPPGPAQLYETAPGALAVKVMVPPSQALAGTGAVTADVVIRFTVVVPVPVQPCALVTVRVYTPARFGAAFGTVKLLTVVDWVVPAGVPQA